MVIGKEFIGNDPQNLSGLEPGLKKNEFVLHIKKNFWRDQTFLLREISDKQACIAFHLSAISFVSGLQISC